MNRLTRCVTAAMLLAPAARADDWPQWIGPTRDDVWRETGVLEKFPESPSMWPVAMTEAFAMVKVGNSECEFLKLTPLSRTSAIAGAVCGVTIRPRSPSGTNKIRLRGALS